ncbi:MAG: hypothetical protein ABH883_05155, partial [Candidatus Omnitrophota bacterium]
MKLGTWYVSQLLIDDKDEEWVREKAFEGDFYEKYARYLADKADRIAGESQKELVDVQIGLLRAIEDKAFMNNMPEG